MLTQAPSYRGPDPDNANGGVYVIHETTPADTPPEYGRHVGDTSFGPPGTTPQALPEIIQAAAAPAIPDPTPRIQENTTPLRPLQPNRF